MKVIFLGNPKSYHQKLNVIANKIFAVTQFLFAQFFQPLVSAQDRLENFNLIFLQNFPSQPPTVTLNKRSL